MVIHGLQKKCLLNSDKYDIINYMASLDNNKKVLVAMSGGIDSSMALKLLIDDGFECVACTMNLYDNETAGVSNSRTCCSVDDVLDARNICNKFNVKHYTFNFKDLFKEKVIDKFVSEYMNGATPNPCIDCNKYMKFDKLFERMKILNCDYVATGHYARIELVNGKYVLKKAIDKTKDQSYVLYFLNQEQLSHLIFPLGNYEKVNVRNIAKENGFVNADKKDSQDICFVPDGDYVKVIRINAKEEIKEGSIVNEAGKVLGRHKGIINYTIGQHRKLGIELDGKYFVTKIDAKNNEIVLGKEESLYENSMLVSNISFISDEVPLNDFKCKVKIRYKKEEADAEVHMLDDKNAKITFKEKQRAITKGQSAVFYGEDIVLGGGIIV